MRNNPLKYTDPTGHWLETLWDLANIALDIYEFQQDPSLINGGALVLDVGAAILPIVPAGAGIIVRGGKAATHIDDATKAIRTAGSLGRKVEKALRFGDTAKILEGIPSLVKNFGGNIGRAGSIPDAFKTRQVKALGRWPDTQAAAKRGESILNIDPWNLELNSNWIDDAIENGDVFHLVTDVADDSKSLLSNDPRNILSVFARELDALLEAGYTRVGDYLIPPK